MSDRETLLASPQHTIPLAGTPLANGWAYGRCLGMNGCGWVQKGKDHTTWKHFESEAAALAYAETPPSSGAGGEPA